MVMMPSQLHRQVEVDVRTGQFPIVTVGDPGIQGAEVTGIHGCGVNTPMAAAVALATIGFVMLLHIPKDRMLAMGR